MDVAALQIVVANERSQTEKELIERLKLKDIGLKIAFEHAAKKNWHYKKSLDSFDRRLDRAYQDHIDERKEHDKEKQNLERELEMYLKEIVARDKALKSMQTLMNIEHDTIDRLHKTIRELEKEKATIKRSSTRQINTLRKKLGMPKKDNKTKKTKWAEGLWTTDRRVLCSCGWEKGVISVKSLE